MWSVECGVDSDGDADLVKLNFTKEINFNELHVSVFVCMQVCRIVVDLYMLYVVQYRVVIFLLSLLFSGSQYTAALASPHTA